MSDPRPPVGVPVTTEWIELGQLLKLAGIFPTGGECKAAIRRGEIAVNSEICRQPGRKLRPGDRVRAGAAELEVTRS